jgi:thioredoxin-related protein
MKQMIILLISGFLVSNITWETDFEKAKKIAQNEHKDILLNFSGSDWCGPCINLRKEIFESDDFIQYADKHLVLLNADFPRLKKHKLSADQQAKNDLLADTYNKEGIFPLTLLLSADGKVLKKWEGFPKVTADRFANDIKSVINAGN